MGRGERETRGEHRGRGERLPSGSRFVFLAGRVLLLLAALAAPAVAQTADTLVETRHFTFGLRVSGVYSTRLMADEISFSILPDSTDLIGDRFRRDSIIAGVGIAPDLTLTAGMTLNEETTIQLAAGYSLAPLEVSRAGASEDAGRIAIGHALVSAQRPIGGFMGRIGAGVLWLHGGEVTAVEQMRLLNPVLELAVGRRWPWLGMDLDVGLAGQVTQVTSEAIEQRGGNAGFVYRLGVEVGLSRRIGR